MIEENKGEVMRKRIGNRRTVITMGGCWKKMKNRGEGNGCKGYRN